jgi:hypothetical protein
VSSISIRIMIHFWDGTGVPGLHSPFSGSVGLIVGDILLLVEAIRLSCCDRLRISVPVRVSLTVAIRLGVLVEAGSVSIETTLPSMRL